MTQNKALDILTSGANVFLTGEPGSGKTFTINQFTEWCRTNYKRYAVTASTGIAATHINGITIHAWASLGIKRDFTAKDIDSVLENKFVLEKLQRTQVLIIDEISMLSGQSLDDLDLLLSAARHSEDAFHTQPFGGIQIVVVGDFFQLPPVTSTGQPRSIFAFESNVWKRANFKVCYLTEQHRQNDKVYLEILSAIRQRRVNVKHKTILKHNKPDSPPWTELYTHNKSVDDVNEKELNNIIGRLYTYKMTAEGVPVLVKFLIKNCMSPENLSLKVGAVVMFTKNKFIEGKVVYVNGTIGVITELSDKGPVVRTTDGDIINVEKTQWKIEEKGIVKAEISQFPLRLAWAITVHKSQGMSLDSARIDLSSAFEYGQGYVALSRVRSLAGLTLTGINEKAFQMHPTVIDQDAIFHYESKLLEKLDN